MASKSSKKVIIIISILAGLICAFYLGIIINASLNDTTIEYEQTASLQTQNNSSAAKQTKKTYQTKAQANNLFYKRSYIDHLYKRYSTFMSDSAAIKSISKTEAEHTYLTQSAAASTFESKSDAISTFESKSDAAKLYLSKSGGTLSGALTAPVYNYSSPKTETITISAHGFTEQGEFKRASEENGAGLYMGSGSISSVVSASISLPDGAIVTAIRFYYFNTTKSKNLSAGFYRTSKASIKTDILAPLMSKTDGGAGYVESTGPILPVTIDNDKYYYWLDVMMSKSSAALYLRAMEVKYTVTTP